MREIIDAIRKHPYVAQFSATGMLAGTLGYFIGEFIVDPLRDLFFKVLGLRLGITDVTTLAHVVTALILISIAAAIIWASFRLGTTAINSNGHENDNRVGGATLVATGTVSDTLTYGEAFHYVLNEAPASQHNAWSLLENAVRRGMVRAIGKESVFWPEDGDNSPPLFSAEWRHITEEEWRNLRGPSLVDAIDKAPRLPFPHCAFPTSKGGHGFGYLRIDESDLKRIWPPQFAPDRVRTRSMIPLIEAATRSLEQTEHTIIPTFDKMFDNTPDGRLGWHCNALWERAPVYGVEPPSRNTKEFPWPKCRHIYSMKVENGVAFLQHRYEKTRIERLQIKESDLNDAINELLEIAADEHDQGQKQ